MPLNHSGLFFCLVVTKRVYNVWRSLKILGYFIFHFYCILTISHLSLFMSLTFPCNQNKYPLFLHNISSHLLCLQFSSFSSWEAKLLLLLEAVTGHSLEDPLHQLVELLRLLASSRLLQPAAVKHLASSYSTTNACLFLPFQADNY